VLLKITPVQKYMKYNTTALIFFTTKKRAHPLPYYLQGLSGRLENT
jgi:hypothetical protein